MFWVKLIKSLTHVIHSRQKCYDMRSANNQQEWQYAQFSIGEYDCHLILTYNPACVCVHLLILIYRV